MNEMKPKPKRSNLEEWEKEGTRAYYVKFHQPVPTFVNKEPVSEFRIKIDNQIDRKYLVESIVYSPKGVIVEAGGEKNIIPLANVMYARLKTPSAE